MGLSLKKLGSKIFDQVNPLDSGRTYQNSAPTNNRSIVGQATHNAVTNTVGNLVGKPIANTAQIVSEAPRATVAAITGNAPALAASQHREWQNLSSPNSIPNFFGSNISNAGQAGYNLAFKAPVQSLLGHGAAADRTRVLGLNQFNQTAPGALIRPVESGISNAFHASKQSQAQVGLDPNATGAQKYFADPVMGALGTVGLTKGAGATGRGVVKLKNTAEEAAAGRQIAKELNKPRVTLKGTSVSPVEPAQKTSPAIVIPKSNESLPHGIISPAKITATDVIGRSTEGVLNKIDSRLGAGVNLRREMGETDAAIAKSNLKVTNSLNKTEQSNLADVLEGVAPPLNEKVNIAAGESRQELDKVHAFAGQAGIELPGKRANYFPHVHNPKTFEPGTKENNTAIQHLVTTGKANSVTDAQAILKQQRDSLLTPYSRVNKKINPYSNLTESRTVDLPGYAKNNAAIHQYLDRSYASIAHARVFGPKDEKLNQILTEVEANGGDIKQAIKSYRQASGLERGSERGQKLSRIATNVQGTTKLGLSAVGNITQRANNAIVGGVGRTVKNQIKGELSKADQNFVEKTGVTSEQVAHEALFGEQGVSQKFRNITAPFFETVEKGNRSNSALVGRDQANSLAKRAAKGSTRAAEKLQRDFGITDYKNGLSEADQIKAARKFVERTQFRTGPQDLPGWTSSPTGRVVSQFKRYPYKQAQFLKREIVDELGRGNALPLMRLVGIGAPVGVAAGALSDKLRGGNYNQSPAEKALNLINDATGASLITSLAQSLYPSSKDANSYIAKAGKALGGPTISDAIKAVEAGFDAAFKKDYKPAERLALSHVPVAGTPASNKLLPYGSTNKPVTADNLANASVADIEAQDKKDVAAFKAVNKSGGYGLTKTESGKYIYQVGNDVKTTTDLKKARDAIALDSFDKTGEDSKIVGDKYYYRDQNDKPQKQALYLHEFNVADSQNQLDMTIAKDDNNVQGWMDSATKQVKALETLRDKYNKDSQADKVADTNKKIETLKHSMAKYAGYGGFSKGKTVSKTVTSAYKYAVSRNAGGSIAKPKVSVATTSSKASSKVASGRKPKVSLKRSKV